MILLPFRKNWFLFVFLGVMVGRLLAVEIEERPHSQFALGGDALDVGIEVTSAVPATDARTQNGRVLPAVTTDRLQITALSLADAGWNQVRVSDTASDDTPEFFVEGEIPDAVGEARGTAGSGSASLSVTTPPVFLRRPMSVLVGMGDDITFEATVSSPEDATYVWKHRGEVIADATSNSLSISEAGLRDAGFYEVIATDGVGSSSSVFHVHISPALSGERELRRWGYNPDQGDAVIPVNPAEVVKLILGSGRALAVHGDGTVVTWGFDNYGLLDIPEGLDDVVDIAAGDFSSAALKADGRIVVWGESGDRNWLEATGLTQVAAIAADGDRLVALRSDGTVWSNYDDDDVEDWTGIVKAVAFDGGVYGVTAAGGVIRTGEEFHTENSAFIDMPEGLSNVFTLSTGELHVLALRDNGTVVGWGRNEYGQAKVRMDLQNIVAVDAGYHVSTVLREDGTLICWGDEDSSLRPVSATVGGVLTMDTLFSSGIGLVVSGAPQMQVEASDVRVNAGSPVTLSPTVHSGPVVSFQWYFNGDLVAGATDRVFRVDALTSDNDGTYVLVAENAVGSVSSGPITVTAVSPVQVTERPLSRMVSTGESTVFELDAQGEGQLSYEWRHDGVAVAGATGPALRIDDAIRSDRGRYEVVVRDAQGGTGFSVAYLEVAPPVGGIVGHGVEYGPLPGAPYNYVSIASSNNSGLALRSDGTVKAWGATPIYPPSDLADVVAIDRGSGHALALRSDGTVVLLASTSNSSNAVPVGLNQVVAIAAGSNYSIALKADGTVVDWGANMTRPRMPEGLDDIVAIATGRPALALRRDGSVVTWGWRSLTNPPTNVVRIAVGDETWLFELRDGSVEKWDARLTSSFPSSGLQALDGNASLILWADRGGNLGTNAPALVDPKVLASTGVLDVAVGGAFYAVLLDSEPLPPEIVTPPESQNVNYGDTVTMQAEVAGSPLFSYQWMKDGEPLGVTTPVLTLSHVQEEDAGDYTLKVSNGYGSVVSTPAALAVMVLKVSPNTRPVSGQSVTLTVNAPEAMTYQWRFRGVPIDGATGATLELNTLSRAQNGFYDVVLITPEGERTAHAHHLNVQPAVVPNLMVADASFTPVFERAGAGEIYATLRLPDGSWLVGGDFVRLGGHVRNYLARFEADGTLDTSSLLPQLDAPVRALLLDHQGRVYVAGDFTHAHGDLRRHLLRLTSTLNLDPTFSLGEGFDGRVTALTLAPDDEVIVGGEFESLDGEYVGSLLRLAPTTLALKRLAESASLDDVRVLAWQSDGKLLVACGSEKPGGNYIVRLNADGTPDRDWTKNGGYRINVDNRVYGLHPLPEGSLLVVGGHVPGLPDWSRPLLSKYTPEAERDPNFVNGAGVPDLLQGFTTSHLLADGRLLVAGPEIPLMLIGTDGLPVSGALPDSPWSEGQVQRIVTGSDGDLHVWGRGSREIDGGLFGTAVMASDLTSATELQGVSTHDSGRVISAQQVDSGHVILQGDFTHVNGAARSGLVRLSMAGEVDPSFVPAVDLTDEDLGPLLVDGRARVIVHDGTHLIRLLPDGAIDPSFVTATSRVGSLALGPDGTLLHAYSPTDDDANNFEIVRLRNDGSTDPTFHADINGMVRGIVPQNSGRIVLGGWMYRPSPSPSNSSGSQRLLNDGTLDVGFQTTGRFGTVVPGIDDTHYLIELIDDQFSVGLRHLERSGLSVAGFRYRDQPRPQTMLPLAAGGFIQARSPGIKYPLSDALLLQRHLANGSPDASFHVAGVDPEISDIKGMLLMDDYSLWLYGDHLSARGEPRYGLMRLVSAQPLELATPPQSTTIQLGETLRVTVFPTGTGPFSYQWYRDGAPVAGAVAATLEIENFLASDMGSYSVEISGPFGTLNSEAAQLNIVPQFSQQPRSQSAALGSSLSFDVAVVGAPAPTLQWRRNGVALLGETGPQLFLSDLSMAQAGIYDVVATNASGSVTSASANLSIFPAGLRGSHRLMAASDGGDVLSVEIANEFQHPGNGVTGLAWQVLLPDGWHLQSRFGDDVATTHPTDGSTDLLEWSWAAPVPSDLNFNYTISHTGRPSQALELVALLTVETGDGSAQYLAQPDPLAFRLHHSADVDRNYRLSLGELLRVIELYNTRVGTTRTGRYRPQLDTVDQFAPDPVDGTNLPEVFHSADTDHNARLSLGELLRVIELYNTREGTTRTGSYRLNLGSADTFQPEP